MGTRRSWIWIALLAAGAVFWFVGVRDLAEEFFGVGDGAERADSDGVPLDTVGTAATAAPNADGRSRGPALFGRAREQRKGVGGLSGRVMDFRTGEPVQAAQVVLSGTGYGGEAVSLERVGDEHGYFTWARVAAGEGYSLHVKGAGRERTLASVEVAADASRDVGTIWLGERGALEGVVLDDEGRGIAGAVVQVHRRGNLLDVLGNMPDLMEQVDRDAEPLGAATTAAQGRFRVEDLDPGPVGIVVRAPGYGQSLTHTVMTSRGAAGGLVTIRLQPLRPLVGVVVDERDRGVAGARVACLVGDDLDSVVFGRQFTATDAGGRFRIDSPPRAAKLSVVVAAEGYPTLLARITSRDDDLRLVLHGGVDVRLRFLEKGTDRAIPGARLTAMFGAGSALRGENTSLVHAVTDDRGEARVTGRPGKLQMLFFEHPERGTGMFAPDLPVAARTILEGPEDPTVEAPRTTLVFRVDRGLVVTGRVTDPDGEPIAGARCRAIGLGGLGAATHTDAEGRYLMRGQGPWIQVVIVQAPGFVQDFETLRMGGGRPEPNARGEVVHDVQMRPAATVAGRVLGPDGKPLAGALVKPGADGAVGMGLGMLTAGREGVTNEAGRYVIDGVYPGVKLRVLARCAGFLDGKSGTFEAATDGVTQASDIVLRKGLTLTVTVVDPRGSRVSGARLEVAVDAEAEDRVRWDPQGFGRNFAGLRTDRRGTAGVWPLPRGHVTVTASHAGFASGRAGLLLAQPEEGTLPAELEVRLREAHVLRGRVVDVEGEPVPNATVGTSRSPDGPDDDSAYIPPRTATTDREGRFTIEGMPDQPLQLFTQARGYKPATVPVPTPRAGAEIVLTRVAADVAARLKEIERERAEILQSLRTGKTDAERQAVGRRLLELQREERELKADDVGR